MPQFHETGYGRSFFEYQLPELIKAINRLADNLEKIEERSKPILKEYMVSYKSTNGKELVSIVYAETKDQAIHKFMIDNEDLSRKNLKDCREVVR